MGEILKDFALKFNGSIRLEAREERLALAKAHHEVKAQLSQQRIECYRARCLRDPGCPMIQLFAG
jgi:hypothetical protein